VFCWKPWCVRKGRDREVWIFFSALIWNQNSKYALVKTKFSKLPYFWPTHPFVTTLTCYIHVCHNYLLRDSPISQNLKFSCLHYMSQVGLVTWVLYLFFKIVCLNLVLRHAFFFFIFHFFILIELVKILYFHTLYTYPHFSISHTISSFLLKFHLLSIFSFLIFSMSTTIAIRLLELVWWNITVQFNRQLWHRFMP